MTQNEQNGERENPRTGETQYGETQYGEIQPDKAQHGEVRGLSGGGSLPESVPARDTAGEVASDETESELGAVLEPSFDGHGEQLPGLPGYIPLWVRLALDYGENSADVTGDLVYSSESDEPAVDDVTATLLRLIREARSMHGTDRDSAADSWQDRSRVDRIAADLESEEWTVDKLSGLWDSAPAPSDPDDSVSPERSGEGGETEPRGEEPSDRNLELEEKIQRRRIMARSTTDEELIAALIEATAGDSELIAYELGETQVQLHVLCAVDSEGYLNVLEVADGTLSLGAPIEDYVAQLVEKLPVTGAAMEGEATEWEALPGTVQELEFYVDGDAAMLVDLPIDMITGLLLAYLPAGTRQVVAAPAGEWTLISADPVDLMALLGLLSCNALIVEGNVNQQHLVVCEEPALEPYSDDEWYLEAFGEPRESIVEEFRWQRVPKRLNRAFSVEELARYDGLLEDLLAGLPGTAPELAGSKIFGSDEEELAQSIANVMALFGVEAESTTGRRLNAYLHDTSNTLALESVLQLLGVPTELALVPTAGFDVASISTARIFGSEDEELAQPAGSAESADAAEATDEAQASEAVDVTFPLEDSVAEATFSENTISGSPVSEDTAAEDDSFEDDEEIEPYPDGYTSPLERSYQLVATGRRVTLAEWMDAINNGHIPYEYTHMGSPEGSVPDSFVEAEEGRLSLDSALREADPVSHEEPHEASVIQRASEGSAALANDAAACDEPAPSTPQDPAPAPVTAPQGPFVQGSAPRSRRKRLTPEQIRAKTRRVGLALGADVTAQSAIAMTLAAVARRRRAQGRASRKFSVAAALFALNATVESALIPAVVRSFERTQLEKHGHEGRPAATPAEVVHPGESGREHHPAKRTLIDELREGNYRTAEEPGEESSPNPSLRERVRNMVRRVRAPKER
ncbi:MAG: hypothetical protein HXO68_04545 [Rothia sp.]|uniref:hypothetical protein n=1 Tax=Rothia sp. (in: high G+C Gram-positive bacteria) TaxID=1885016 RepID=UPI001CACFF64|nr:hypothetical protein [Rothia sp. (in: high G+C Gram-positive bacteria)]MBF1676395.1 hypothetical protein [Rothia sp. (in: high G+C Gram-positive bacteria)]